MKKDQDAIDATNFLRSNYPRVAQRGLADIIDAGQASELPGYGDLDYHQRGNVHEAVRTAGRTAPYATIYGRIRRYDKIKRASEARTAGVEQNEAEINEQQPVTA